MQPSIYVSPYSRTDLYVYPTIYGTFSTEHAVWIQTGRGTPLAGAEVHWRLQGSSNATGTATSNDKGTAYIKLALGPTTDAVCVELIIESLSKPGFYFEPEAPIVRSYCPARVVAGAPSIAFTKVGDTTVATASVSVRDQHGNPAPGVTLTAGWFPSTAPVTATTDNAGIATFRMELSEPTCMSFALKGLTKPGYGSAPITTPSAIKCPPNGNDIVVTPFMTTAQ